MSTPAATPPAYRYRTFLFAAIYAGSFALGAAADGRWRHGQPLAAYLAIGHALPALGPRAILAVALGLTAAGFGLRVWGSSYLHADSVWSGDIRTGSLHVDGPFRYTRNPLYLGTIVLAAGVGLLGTLLAFGLVVAGNVAACRALALAEEHALRVAYGERYGAYARRVPRLLPTLRPAPAGHARASLGAGLATEIATSGFVLAMLEAFVTQRPGTPSFWLLFASGPLIGAALRQRAHARR